MNKNIDIIAGPKTEYKIETRDYSEFGDKLKQPRRILRIRQEQNDMAIELVLTGENLKLLWEYWYSN